jgi:hypothetical protein
MRAWEFQVSPALAGLPTATTAVDMTAKTLPLDLGFRDISHKVIFKLAGRFEIAGAAMGTLLRVDVVFHELGVGRWLRSEEPGVLAMLLAAVIDTGTFGVVVALARTLAALVDSLQFVFQLRQATTQFGILRLQLSNSLSKLLLVHNDRSLPVSLETAKLYYLTVTRDLRR